MLLGDQKNIRDISNENWARCTQAKNLQYISFFNIVFVLRHFKFQSKDLKIDSADFDT